MELVIDRGIFEAFQCWSGSVPAGCCGNWLGVLTSAQVWAFPQEIAAIYSQERYETFPYPTNDEHVLDWVPLLEAVLAAQDPFVMVALGAGWGRWLSGGAFAAKQRDLAYRLVGVEAEPQHFRWMQSHFENNHIDLSRCRLINAAASAQSGDCWFYVGNPAAWYGQSIVPDQAVSLPQNGPVDLGYETPYGTEHIRRIRSVSLAEIIGDLPYVDYLHMDIQGTEHELLSADPDVLQEKIRMVNIGTHSVEIEADLRCLFAELGWSKRYDVAMNTEVLVRLGDHQGARVAFGDGVQVWVNPRLKSGHGR